MAAGGKGNPGPEGRRWGSAKSSCVNGFAGGPAVARCSGSAVIVTGATGIAASDAGGKRGGTSKARKAGSITATGNGPTGNAAATEPA